MEEVSVKDFTKYLRPEVASRLSSFELKARYIAEGFLLGLHKSPYHGFSIEFSQHRPYMQGDAPRDIDWKVYGKTDRFFVKQYEEETNLRCNILLDCSRSMQFCSGSNITKFDYGAMLAAGLSYLAIHQKDAAGLSLYAENIIKQIPPKATGIYLNRILAVLADATTTGATESSRCFSKIAENIKHKGMVIIISDLLDDVSSILHGIRLFRYKKNEVIVFHILDPLERSFAFGRDAVFKGLETDEEITTQPLQIQLAYKEAFEQYRMTMVNECLKNGIEYNLIETSEPFDKALFAYLNKRSKLY